MLKELKLWLTIPLFVANGFILGLVLGAIPAMINKTYSMASIGLIMPFFYLSLSSSGFISGRTSDKIGRFKILYLSLAAGVITCTMVIFATNLLSLVASMVIAGFFSASNGVTVSALFIDLFGQKIKEAQAAGGIIATLIGIVPAFLLPKYFSTNQLLILGIILCFTALFFLRILETKQRV